MNLCGKKIFNNELNQYGLTRPVKTTQITDPLRRSN
jgi:hypothetical protein